MKWFIINRLFYVIVGAPVNRGKFIFAGYNPTTGHYGVSTLTLVE